MEVIATDNNVQIERLQLGPWGTNAYIVICQKTRDSVVIDAPADAPIILDSLQGTDPRYLLLTHNHRDHVGALSELHAALKVPLAAHALDAGNLPSIPEILLKDGDTVSLGNINLEVLHTPGHTPGSLCFRTGSHLLSGDTIFPGGPGKTRSPADFELITKSITGKIFTLPDGTRIYPGHGETTLVEKEKEAFAVFSARPQRADLCGDVLWRST